MYAPIAMIGASRERDAARKPNEHHQRDPDQHGDEGDRNDVFGITFEC